MTADSPLLFNWGPPRPTRRALLLFMALSVLGHAVCFYIFQVAYPPSVALLPPPAQLTVLPNNTDAGRTLLRWAEAEDPALTLTTMRPPDSKNYALPNVPHTPSYATYVPHYRDAPAWQPDLSIPSTAAPGPVATPRPRVAAATPVVRRTNVFASEELQAIGELHQPAVKFAAQVSGAPENMRFRVAVNSLGEVRFVFPLNSSGDVELNRQAASFIAACRFTPSPNAGSGPDTWGVMAIEWGNDVGRATP